MLKNIDPLLNADILYALRAMGHGDTVVIADANFPADSVARKTPFGKVLRMDVSAPRAVRAVLSVMPLDTFVDDPAHTMAVVGNPNEVPPVCQEIQAEINQAEGKSRPQKAVERMAFYERAQRAYCVIATAEPRFYGNVILTKGVIPPKIG